jgi:hypothetical protein
MNRMPKDWRLMWSGEWSVVSAVLSAPKLATRRRKTKSPFSPLAPRPSFLTPHFPGVQ